MNYLHVFILSVIEGITEFLPISSTGHLILTAKLLGVTQTEFAKSFEIFIQLGAILAIIILYFHTLIKNINIWKKILTAFIPTAVIGFAFYGFVKQSLLGNAHVTVWALGIGGIILILLEVLFKEKEHHVSSLEAISYKQACLIGIVQSLSIVPGVSRAAATIIGGSLVGLKRKTAVEFSFLLAIPTMIAASGLDLIKTSYSFSPNEFGLLAIGTIGSFITAYITVKYLLAYIQKHTFIPFGIYRILIAIVFLLFIIR